MYKCLNIVWIAFFIVSCGRFAGKKKVEIDGLYEVSVPSMMVEDTNLHEEASLQYKNIWKELYVICIEEDIESVHQVFEEAFITEEYPTNLKGYSKLLYSGIEESVQNAKWSYITDTTINSLPVQLRSLTAEIDNMNIFYKTAIFKGKEHYYQFLTWTLSEKKRDNLKAMNELIRSFKEK